MVVMFTASTSQKYSKEDLKESANELKQFVNGFLERQKQSENDKKSKNDLKSAEKSMKKFFRPLNAFAKGNLPKTLSRFSKEDQDILTSNSKTYIEKIEVLLKAEFIPVGRKKINEHIKKHDITDEFYLKEFRSRKFKKLSKLKNNCLRIKNNLSDVVEEAGNILDYFGYFFKITFVGIIFWNTITAFEVIMKVIKFLLQIFGMFLQVIIAIIKILWQIICIPYDWLTENDKNSATKNDQDQATNDL